MRIRRIVSGLAAVALLPIGAVASSVVQAPPAFALGEPSMGTPSVIDPGVNNTSATYFNTGLGGSEPSVALDPSNPQQAVMTAFFKNSQWTGGGANASLLQTLDGGQTWTLQGSIPPPPGIPNGGPFDQTVDFGRNGTLFGTFLVNNQPPGANSDVVSGDTTNPAQAASWQWNAPGGNTQLTNNNVAGNNVDQPWLIVNRDTGTAANDDTYVAYSDFAATNARVAVSLNVTPPNFNRDNNAGSWNPQDGTNPGTRIAKDTTNGNMYAIWQTATAGSGGAGVSPHNVTLHINRSTDSGQNWTLNGSASGITKNTGDQDEGDFKFGAVNALLGGVEHIAVNPTNHDVWVVYGTDGDKTGAQRNRIFVTRYTDANAAGGGNLTEAAGFPKQVGTSTDAALPSVAVTSDGVVGILYTTFDGNNGSGIPTFSAHLARSDDTGATFTDSVLESFTSPNGNNGNARQRVLGDFQQIKANGSLLYGTFSGNRQNFRAGATNTIDPVFFRVPGPSADVQTTKTGSPNPVTAGTNLTYTITSKNNGPNDALNVTMNDTMPAGTTLVSFSPPPGWSCSTPAVGANGPVACSKSSMTNGESDVFTLVVHVSPSAPNNSTLSNTATTQSNAAPPGSPPIAATPDPNPTNNSSTANVKVITSADLTASKTGPARAVPGTNATYTITVHNNGPSDAQNVTVTDATPAGSRFASLTSPPGWTCTTPPPGGSGTITCTKPTVAAGETDTFNVTLHFLPTVPSGTNITNTATVTSTTSDPNPGNNSGNATTLVICDHTITGTVLTGLTLNGGSWCIRNADIAGAMNIGPSSTTVVMINSTVRSSINATNPDQIAFCGNTIQGSVGVTGATGFVLIGDTTDDDCAGNTIQGALNLYNNTGAVEVADNPRISSVSVYNNSGTGPYPEDKGAEIENNTIVGSLSCGNNVPAASNGGRPNTVSGRRSGECATPTNF